MLFAFVIFTCVLIVCVALGVTIIAPLLFGLVLFAGIALRRGHSFADVGKMIWRGVKKSAPVMVMLTLIGMLTAMWHAGGSIPLCVYYGLSAVSPRFFILSAFVLSCCFSYAIGSSFGTVATIGIVIMAMAQSGGADIRMAAGAVLSGAFFGDRCSPVSSSASLVAAVTETRLYANIRNMFRTAFVPTLLTLAAYLFLSAGNPMQGGSEDALAELASLFELHPVMALPVVIVLILPPLGVGVKKAMLASILAGALLGFFVRGATPLELLLAAAEGCKPVSDGRFAQILSGGGVLSMMKAVGTVFVASAYAGIFDGTGMLDGVQELAERMSRRVPLYHTTITVSVVTVMLACNQTLAVILTNQIMNPIYARRGLSKEAMAIALEDSVILIAGLIPWSIAAAIPLVLMETDASSIVYALFLWLTPLVNALLPRVSGRPAISREPQGNEA